MTKFLVSFMLLLISTILISQTNKIKDLENQRKLALQEIENTTLLLNTTKKTTETLLNRIELLSEQINSRNQVVMILNQEINAISREQEKIEKDIISLQSSLKTVQDEYAKAIKGISYRKQNKSKLLYILSGNSLSESLRRMKYLKDYSIWRSNQSNEITGRQADLKVKIIYLAKTKDAKEALLDTRRKEQLKLEEEELTHKSEIEEASKKQKELQAIIEKKQRQANNLNTQIQKLIADEVRRQEREARKAAEESERLKKEKEKQQKENTITQPETNANTADIPYAVKTNAQLSSNFASNKGRLPMPVSGTFKIVGKFGIHQHDRWKITTNSNGVDIQAKPGANAKAVFDGEVSRVVAFPGFNNCIIIRHGEYYTFYGNIKTVQVKQGEKVSTGQNLGEIFTDTDTNSSLLHFQLWNKTTKLDPEPWLKK